MSESSERVPLSGLYKIFRVPQRKRRQRQMGKKILFKSTESKEPGLLEEARRRKAILDDVMESFLPVKEAVKKWDISASTYYRWKRCYEKKGLAGLSDMISQGKIEQTDKRYEREDIDMEEEKREDMIDEGKEEEVSAGEETEEIAEMTKEYEEEERTMASEVKQGKTAELGKTTPPPPGGSVALWAIFGAVIGALGILIVLSLYNSNTYYVKQDGDEVTVWKGKFHPFSKERTMVEDIEPIILPEVELGEMTKNVYRTPEEVLNDIFKLMINKADEQLGQQSRPDPVKAKEYLGVAEKLATTPKQQKILQIRMAKAEYLTAIDKMVEGKNIMIKMYREALTHLQKAKDYGFEDTDKIEARTEEINGWLEQLTGKAKKAQEGS